MNYACRRMLSQRRRRSQRSCVIRKWLLEHCVFAPPVHDEYNNIILKTRLRVPGLARSAKK